MQSLIKQTIINKQISDIEFRVITYLNYKILWENKHILIEELSNVFHNTQVKLIINNLIKKNILTKLNINNKEYIGIINNQNQIIW